MRLIIVLLFVFVAWRWGDWRNWHKYYPTIVFMIAVDLLHCILTYNHPLWLFHKTLPNHTLNSLLIMFTAFPATVLIYVSHYPRSPIMKILYVTFWVFIYSGIEMSSYYFGGITYQNGWNLGFSVLLNVILFVLLRVHFYRPLLAWGIVFLITVFISYYFDLYAHLK